MWFLTFKGFNLMTPRLGTAFTFIIGRGHKESHGDLNKINRVKTNNKNVMKIPVISVIKKFLYSSLQYHWCPIVLIVELESIDSSSIYDNKKILKKINTVPGRIIIPNPARGLTWKQVITFWTVFNIWELVIQYI